MKKQVLLFALFAPGFLFAQLPPPGKQISHSAVTPAGAYGTDPVSQKRICWTLGEIAAVTATSGNLMLTPGFQQHFEFDTIVGAFELEGKTATFNVFPNPFRDQFTIDFQEAFPHRLVLFDWNGRVLYRFSSNERTVNINAEALSPGPYILAVYGPKQTLATSIKLIKI